ncbi:MAG: DegQ family serine endoprotease [Pseudomonadota bacterium]
MFKKTNHSVHHIILMLIIVCVSVSAQARLPLEVQTRDGVPTLAPVMKNVTPAVVNIQTRAIKENAMMRDPFFRRFFNQPNQPQREQRSAGSGVIIDAQKGYIMTNHHVIENADEISVTLKDGRTLKAKFIGSDAGTDIALLQINADKLAALEAGDSENLEVGDFVIAIGNPFGLGQTVTSGIVSALGRSGLNIEGYEDFIQTDASINPGNSGGALVDLKGRLIGINTAIIGPAGGNVGIGFAVPINMAKAVMEQLIEYGEIKRGRLGILIQKMTPDLAEALDVDASKGALISQVEPGSPAEKAKLQSGDVVTAVNGKPVRGPSDLRNKIGLVRAGEKVDVTLLREGKSKTVNIRVGKFSSPVVSREIAPQLGGAAFEDHETGIAMFSKTSGVRVTEVDRGSPAWQYGLRKDDVITEVNRKPIESLEEFQASLEQVNRTFALTIEREDSRLLLVFR